MLKKLPRSVGRALQGWRAGFDKLACQSEALAAVPSSLTVTSPAFEEGQPVPVRYTDDGEKMSPPIAWRGVPERARSVAILIEDADSPTPQPLVHAIIHGLPGHDGLLTEGALDHERASRSDAARLGRNSYLMQRYLPPDPPPGHGAHRYVIQVFAADVEPGFGKAPGRSELLDWLAAHALAKGSLVGTYTRR